MKQTIENKKQLLDEHFCYEVNMLVDLVLLLCQRKVLGLETILLECSILHARNLLDFLYNEETGNDDALASDFYDEELKWEELRPTMEELLRIVKYRFNKEMGHLTYQRLEKKKEEKLWTPALILKEIHKIITLFLNNLPSKYSSDELGKIKFKLSQISIT